MMNRNAPPPIAEWFRYRVLGLATLAWYSFRFGLIYTPLLDREVRVPPALGKITAFLPQATEHWQPVWFLGFLWATLGLMALVAIVLPGLHNFVYIGAVAYSAYWMLAYVLNPFTGGTATDLLTAAFLAVPVSYILLTGLMTRPGNPGKRWQLFGGPDVE